MSDTPRVPADAVPADAVLVDVREQDEWDAGHAPEAVHLPMSEIQRGVTEVPEGPLAVVCRVGGRCAQVTAFLRQRGHEAVNVSGGMLTWEAEGRPLTTDCPGPARVV